MSIKETIILKILGFISAALYCWSFLWISLIYLFGGLYYPFNELGLKAEFYFEVFVAFFSISIIWFIMFKSKGKTFIKIFIQDLGLILISVPFFATITGFLRNEPVKPEIMYAAIFILTICVINVNDWLKLKKPATNSG
ncbi:MAG: hypothetical protein CUR32_00035 [Flavobacterium sp.]|nr:MAG: hypothetical protein CUR32_00035 [Flavobacterium sp.] [Flavobacterium sp. FEMGT703F]